MWNGCCVIMYHYVRDTEKTPYPDIKALGVKNFIGQLDWLQSHGTIIGYDKFRSFVRGEEKPDGPTALLTFDDGFVDCYETVFPLLKERGLSGVFFPCDSTLDTPPALLNVHKIHFLLAKLGAGEFTAHIYSALSHLDEEAHLDQQSRQGLYRFDSGAHKDIKQLLNYELSYDVADAVLDTLFTQQIGSAVAFAEQLYLRPDHIREMAAAGMTFGGHTRMHRVLSRLLAEEQREELAGGIQLLRSLTEQKHIPFCYPYGHPHTFDQMTIGLLQECGYDLAFSIEPRNCTASEADMFRLPRMDTRDLPSNT